MFDPTELPIRLACRCCETDEMDFVESLVPACKAGWVEIIEAPTIEVPIFCRQRTHIGTCPRCQELQVETTAARSYRLCGLTIRFRTAS